MLHFADPSTRIEFVGPKIKRNFFEKDLKSLIEALPNARKRYNLTKNGSRDVVLNFLNGSIPLPYGWPPLNISQDLRTYYETAKKKDDLADAFLLGLILLHRREEELRPRKKRSRKKKVPKLRPTPFVEPSKTKREGTAVASASTD